MNLKKENINKILLDIFITTFALFLAVIVGGIVMLAFGYDPIAAYSALIKGAFGTTAAFTNTLTTSVPIMLTGLAVALAFKCGVFNIGAEGQLIAGMLCAAVAGIYIDFLPSVLHIPVTLIAAILGGMAWAFIPAFLKQKFNVNVVIGTIMFNYVASSVSQYFVLGPMKADGVASATNPIQTTAELPNIMPPPNVLNLGYIIAVLAACLIFFLLFKTTTGYEMRAVGINPISSKWAGINVEKNMFLALVISGGLAGLAGGVELTGTLNKIVVGAAVGYGFNGIPVALIAHNNPLLIILSSLLLAAMRTGSLLMQTSAGVSRNVVDMVQGFIIVFLCAEFFIRYYITKKNNTKNKITNAQAQTAKS